MPFINGRFYANPAYGRALEHARANSAPDPSIAEDSDTHWVTINQHHVLIHEGRTTDDKRTRKTREAIVRTAKKYNGSADWAFDKKKDDFPPGTNKCNKFVYDVTREAGAPAVVIGSDGRPRPPLAGEWADQNTPIAGWRVLGKSEMPQPGDVTAYKLPGGGAAYTGHSGIVTAVDPNGTVHAIAAHENVVGPDDKFNSTPHRIVSYRRYEGGS